ncbi:MAG: hypothetical protein V7720_17070 [Halioglobus sp.]
MAQGLNQLGNGAWAWLAHSNSWGWSNAGLISDGEESLHTHTPPNRIFDGELSLQVGDEDTNASTA